MNLQESESFWPFSNFEQLQIRSMYCQEGNITGEKGGKKVCFWTFYLAGGIDYDGCNAEKSVRWEEAYSLQGKHGDKNSIHTCLMIKQYSGSS